MSRGIRSLRLAHEPLPPAGTIVRRKLILTIYQIASSFAKPIQLPPLLPRIHFFGGCGLVFDYTSEPSGRLIFFTPANLFFTDVNLRSKVFSRSLCRSTSSIHFCVKAFMQRRCSQTFVAEVTNYAIVFFVNAISPPTSIKDANFTPRS